MLTWRQLGYHQKPVCFLNVEGFWTPLLAHLDGAVAAGFLREEQRAQFHMSDSVEGVLRCVSEGGA